MWLAFDLFIWGKVVSGMRGTLPHSSKLSATERLYVKSLCWPGHNISAPGFAHVLNFSNKPRKNSQSIVSKKNPSPPPSLGVTLPSKWVTLDRGSPCPQAPLRSLVQNSLLLFFYYILKTDHQGWGTFSALSSPKSMSRNQWKRVFVDCKLVWQSGFE